MAALSYDISYAEPRNRLTNAFRYILAIPHLLVVGVWSYFVNLLAVIQWFIILFTGQRNQGLWDLQHAWLGYYGRVLAYVDHMYDPYPKFGTEVGEVPVSWHLDDEEPANRLTNGLRFIWAIPALLIVFVLAIGLFVVVVISWFAILFTGKHPRGMFDFSLRVMRYMMQTQAYTLLMTDTYPKWDSGAAPSGGDRWTGGPGSSQSQSQSPLTPPGGPLPPPGS